MLLQRDQFLVPRPQISLSARCKDTIKQGGCPTRGGHCARAWLPKDKRPRGGELGHRYVAYPTTAATCQHRPALSRACKRLYRRGAFTFCEQKHHYTSASCKVLAYSWVDLRESTAHGSSQNDSGSRYTAQQAKAARLCRTARLLRRRRTATLSDPGYFRGRGTPHGFYRNRNDSGNADAFAVSVSQSPPRLQSRVALRRRDWRPVRKANAPTARRLRLTRWPWPAQCGGAACAQNPILAYRS
jgi:hypothetical protein